MLTHMPVMHSLDLVSTALLAATTLEHHFLRDVHPIGHLACVVCLGHINDALRHEAFRARFGRLVQPQDAAASQATVAPAPLTP